MARLLVASVLAVIMVTSFLLDCNKKMSDKDFVELYVKIAKATEENLAQSEQIPQIHEKILKESGFTREQFTAFEKKYRDQPEKWQEIWKAIEKASQETSPPPQ